MKAEDIAIGQEVEIDVKIEGKTLNFKSEVILVNLNFILIKGIIIDDQTIGFTDKHHINLIYKNDDKLYIWEGVTVKLVKYDGRIYHKIDLIGMAKPYNRRGAYRLYIGEDMTVYINSAKGPTALTVLIKDISESGFAMISKEELDINRMVKLKLYFAKTNYHISGVIVRKENLDHLHSHLYGCKFTEKNPNLIKYIMKKQTEVLKKKSESYNVVKHGSSELKETKHLIYH